MGEGGVGGSEGCCVEGGCVGVGCVVGGEGAAKDGEECGVVVVEKVDARGYGGKVEAGG